MSNRTPQVLPHNREQKLKDAEYRIYIDAGAKKEKQNVESYTAVEQTSRKVKVIF